MYILQKRIKLLLYINVVLLLTATSTHAQEGHNFYVGGNYSFIQKLKACEDECPNISTGDCDKLNYEYKRTPFIDAGYFYLRNLKSYPAYGWHIGLNYKSFIRKDALLIDENYYDYYNRNGFYPNIKNSKTMFNYLYLNAGLNYSNEKIYVLAGLITAIVEKAYKKTYLFDGRMSKSTYTNYFSYLDTYLRFGYKLNDKFSIYTSFQTMVLKEVFSRSYFLSLGINYTVK